MKIRIIFALIAVVVLAVLAFSLPVNLIGAVAAEEPVPEFRTYTKAVCEERGNLIYCEDRIFAEYNGIVKEITGKIYFNGKKYDFGEMNLGSAYFSSDWVDPRG